MNKKISIVLAGLLVLSATYFVGASQTNLGKVSADTMNKNSENKHVVVVQGEGEILVKPDVAYINLGVQTKHADTKVAQDENKERMNKVMDALVKSGIKKADIATTNYSIYQTYDNNDYDDSKPRKMVFQVNNAIKVTIKNLDKVGSYIDIATKAGANDINGIAFGVLNTENYYNDALKLAMKNAKSKANTIMSTFGKKADVPTRVSEAQYYSAPVTREAYKMTSAGSDTPVEAGDLTIKAVLNVEYEY